MIDIEGAEAIWAERPPGLPRFVRLVITEFHPQRIGSATLGAAITAVIDEGFRVVGMSRDVVASERQEP